MEVDSIELEIRTVLLLKLREQTRQSVFEALEILAEDPNVEYSHPNFVADCIDAYEAPTETYSLNDSIIIGGIELDIDLSDGEVPNDELIMSQLGMYITEAYKAWSTTTGDGSVSVGVIDLSVNAVADLAANLDLANGINYDDPDALPTNNDDGHGTHVAGIIGAVGNNSIGVAGVCWDVNIVPFKIKADNNGPTVFSTTAAVAAADEMELDIINLSLNFRYWDVQELFEDVIVEFDGIVVIAAGNFGNNLDNTLNYPAYFPEKFDNVLVVGASCCTTETTDGSAWNEIPWNGSNYGKHSVSLFAPGVGIISTVPQLEENNYADYVAMNRTSMAAPHVAGAAALILSEYPNATAEQVVDAILFSVDKVDEFSDLCVSGGRLNIRRALEYFTNVRGNGDVNMDGNVDNIDLIILARYLQNLITLDGDQLLRADINKDNAITQVDEEALATLIVEQ